MNLENTSETKDTDSIAAISDALMQARRDAALLPEFPGELPETLESAYAVQTRSIGLWGDQLAGWKVAKMPPTYHERFIDRRLVGPIFQKHIVHSKEGSTSIMPVFDGFAAVEGEFVFCLGETPDQDRLHIGVEIASSPLHQINDMGPLASICDLGNNRGLVVGPEIPNWQSLKTTPFTVEAKVNGDIEGSKIISSFPDDAVDGLSFWRSHAAKNNLPINAGVYISSGAITGVHETPIGGHASISFGPFGTLNIEFISAK